MTASGILTAPVILLTNQKGGVGKTTMARELGIAVNARGYRVVLIDADPQGNLSKSLLEAEGTGLYEALEGGSAELVEIRPGLFLLRGDARLAALEKRYLGDVDAYEKLSSALQAPLFADVDVILIDSPPSLGIMTLNGLAAASHFVIPVRPALYSLQGTNDLLLSVAKVKKSLNPSLSFLGVILNEYQSQPIISRQIRNEIAESFGDKVFKTAISRTVKIEEAIASRRGVVDENAEGNSKIAGEINNLAGELLERLCLRLEAGPEDGRS